METAEKSLKQDPNKDEHSLILPAIFISLIVFGMPIVGSLAIIFHLGG